MFVTLLKELNLVSLSKALLKKVLFILLLASFSAAQALTLGEFSVESFLDKPLKAEIIANANSGDNLDSLEVIMADANEFEQAGIVRSDSLDNFKFQLVKTSDDVTQIIVTTDEVITDPYIHMLLKVRWNGGQILREFTALIDPPLYSSQPVNPVDTAVTSAQEIEASTTEQTSFSSGVLSDGLYGPVDEGDTLSEIAQEIKQSYPDLSIYQIMYVLYQDNKSAFIGENINGLAKGSTLVFDGLDSEAIVGKQDGVNFFYSQLSEWSAQQDVGALASANETVIDSAVSNEDTTEQESASSDSSQQATDETNTEEVDTQAETTTPSDEEVEQSSPEFQVASTDVQTGAEDSGDLNNQLISDLETDVLELEASVESAKLENDELKETISLLETQLADSNRIIELNNQELASLAAQNEANQNQGSEVSNTVESSSQNEQVEPQIVEEPEPAVVEEVEQPTLSPVTEASDSIVDKIISFLQGAWRYIAIGLLGLFLAVFLKMRASKKEEDEIETFETTFTVYPEDSEGVKDDASNRVSSEESDAKAKELINKIKSEKTAAPDEIANLVGEEASESSVMSKLDMDALREATQSVDNTIETGEITKESSFLTVYNDGDVIVNADEIDPIAESEVYIAYGREDQGEEVLVDGIKNFPERNDIKIALLGLYAKSNKRDKFDGIYKSLLDNGVESNPKEWDAVQGLKNTIDVKNGIAPSADVSDPAAEDNIGLVNEEITNSEFIVDSEVNDLSEIDIKSETFEISEIDFGSDDSDAEVPTLKNDVVEQDAGQEIGEINLGDEISIDFQADVNEIDSNTIEVESFTLEVEESPIDDLEKTIDAAIQEITEEVENADANATITSDFEDIGDVDFTSNVDTDSGDFLPIEEEISQIDFTEEAVNSLDNSIQIDLDNEPTMPGEITDAIDIGAEISEISYDDEVSLTDVMELNVNDVDLNSIPDEQDLTSVVTNSATTLINEVDYVEDDTIQNEVTIDLTETMDFVESDGNESGLTNMELDDVSIDDTVINLDDGELPTGESDPETQLDLAKVFLELDDVSGAVKILKDLTDNDIVGEEARELLSKHS